MLLFYRSGFLRRNAGVSEPQRRREMTHTLSQGINTCTMSRSATRFIKPRAFHPHHPGSRPAPFLIPTPRGQLVKDHVCFGQTSLTLPTLLSSPPEPQSALPLSSSRPLQRHSALSAVEGRLRESHLPRSAWRHQRLYKHGETRRNPLSAFIPELYESAAWIKVPELYSNSLFISRGHG